MTPGDVARVLAKAAAFDARTIGEADAAAWFEVIGPLSVADALEAVTRHYATETRRVMPADVVRLAKQVKRERERVEGVGRSEPRALPSRFEDDLSREVRIKRGLATAKEVLGPVMDRLAERRQEIEAAPSAMDQLRELTPGPDWDQPDRDEGDDS